MDREIKGVATELLCQTEFVKRGFNVSVPISNSSRYDFIVDICGKLLRFQAKHSNKSKTGLQFLTTSSHLSSSGCKKKNYTEEDIDYFCTYFDSKCYIVPLKDVGERKSITLAFRTDWKNGHHVMLAEKYEIDFQLKTLIN